MSKTINQFLILFAIIIGTFGKLLVHSLDVGLHFKDMLKSQLSFLHNGAFVTEYHYLG